jgi:hypothetical protein
MLLDRASIEDALCRYARGVDRSDWELVRAAYHPDAYDDHGDYKGGVDGLIDWLRKRFAQAAGGMHFLGNCLIEFAEPRLALAETSFISQRLRPAGAEEAGASGSGDTLCRQSWGRYVDRFECRDGEWRIARRTVVLDAIYTFPASSGTREGSAVWSRRDRGDILYRAQAELRGD